MALGVGLELEPWLGLFGLGFGLEFESGLGVENMAHKCSISHSVYHEFMS